MITQDELKTKLTYCPETGLFSWNKTSKNYTRKRASVGGLMLNGYITIRINRKQYYAHRLAYLFMTGNFPSGQIDHKNRVRNDNRWINLRDVTPTQNNLNRSQTRELPVGVYQIQRKGRPGIWYASKFQINGKQMSSSFRKVEDAIKWRKQKEQEWGAMDSCTI